MFFLSLSNHQCNNAKSSASVKFFKNSEKQVVGMDVKKEEELRTQFLRLRNT